MSGPVHADAEAVELYLTVLRCQAGDERAFARLMDRFAPRTLGYLRGLVGDAAEDVHQDVWITVYRSVAGVANPRAFRTWLFRTTRHRALDFLRRERRERELIDDTPADQLSAPELAVEPDDDTIDDSLLHLVHALPIPQREACLLHYWGDAGYAEIALITGCSIGTVRSRLHHAKRKIRNALTARG
jgi:RNA polymerase sigma-70 factor (ECF subfamily)